MLITISICKNLFRLTLEMQVLSRGFLLYSLQQLWVFQTIDNGRKTDISSQVKRHPGFTRDPTFNGWIPGGIGGIPAQDPGSHLEFQVGLVRSPEPLPPATLTWDPTSHAGSWVGLVGSLLGSHLGSKVGMVRSPAPLPPATPSSHPGS